MKIAICLFHYFPYGGLQRDFLRISKALLQRGHAVHVYTMRWQGDRLPGIELHLLPQTAWRNHQKIKQFSDQALAQIQHEAFDFVLGFNKMPHLDAYYAADVCFQERVRQKYGFLAKLMPRTRRYIQFEKAVFEYGLSTQILMIAEKQQSVFMKHYHTEPERFHLLPPGISKDRCVTAEFAKIRSEKRQELGIKDHQKLMMQIGSGFKTKGLDRSLTALALLPEELRTQVVFCVVGQDRPKQYQRYAERLGIAAQVRFLGGRDDIPMLLQAADVLIHPAYHENTGTVLLEAMVAGLPVLTTDVCGYAHYIDEAQAGIVVQSPFLQSVLNKGLQKILQPEANQVFREQAIAYSKTANIYSLTEKACDDIEHFAEQKNAVFAS